MLIETTQGLVNIEVLDTTKRVGIKLSGGADSALLMYLLSKYKIEERPDLEFLPATNVCKQKPYNQIHADRVLDFIKHRFGVEVRAHMIIKEVDESELEGVHDLCMEFLYHGNMINEHFMAITSFPPDGAMDMSGTNEIVGLDRSRNLKPTKEGRSNRPFYNLDKKGIAELYHRFGLMDTLFPLTRSCEAHTHDFSKHCGKCWWCRERQWAFGRLD